MDSPKCPMCLESGLISNTYKVAGKPRFKCQTCGKYTEKVGLDEREFKWRTEFHVWKEMVDERIEEKEEKKKEEIKKQMDEIAKLYKPTPLPTPLPLEVKVAQDEYTPKDAA